MKIKANPAAAAAPESASSGSGGTARSRSRLHRRTATAVAAVVAAVMLQAVAQQAAFKVAAGRAPRVYNALITSDQQLLPSQADPIVAPVFRPFQYFYDWSGTYAAPSSPVVSPTYRADVDAAVAATEDASSEPARKVQPAEDDGVRPAVIKNNRPADSSVPDVPPPPLPVSRGSAAGKKDKKKPEEFPPAPVGFAI